MRVDLHTHTTASDGELEPRALFAMQAAAGVELMAITDHDTLAGWSELQSDATLTVGPRLIPGIEFSACDGRNEIHIIGLHMDPADECLTEAIRGQQARRWDRAWRIDARLQWLGIPGALLRATVLAGGAPPGRPHFARFLVETGRVRDVDAAFRRYLGGDKPAAVPPLWPEIEQVVSWIRGSGGRPVLAHPLAYGMSRSRLHNLVRRFADCGGEAIEVAMPNLRAEQLRAVAELARGNQLLASAGSDFHAPAQTWRLPSRVPELPSDVLPVWHDWL